MDATQSLINVGFAIAGFFGGWVLNRITKSLDRLDEEIRQFPNKYLAKDDYHRDLAEIKVMLDKIFSKLDNKADK
jgi:hypothetical protein